MLGQDTPLNSHLSQSMPSALRDTDRDVWAAIFLICWCACWVHLTGECGLSFVWVAAIATIATKFIPRTGVLLGGTGVSTLLFYAPGVLEVYPYSIIALLFLLINFLVTVTWPISEVNQNVVAEPEPTDPAVWEQSLLNDAPPNQPTPKAKPQGDDHEVEQLRTMLHPLQAPQESLKCTLQRILAQQQAAAKPEQLSLREIEDILRPVIQPQESIKDVLFRIMQSPVDDIALLEAMLQESRQQCRELQSQLSRITTSPCKVAVVVASAITSLQQLTLAFKEALWREGQLTSMSNLQSSQLADKDAQLKIVLEELQQLKEQDVTQQLKMAERQLAIKDQIIQRLQATAPPQPAPVVTTTLPEATDSPDDEEQLQLLELLAAAEAERRQLQEELFILIRSTKT